MDLKEWAIHYIKQRDLITRDLVSYKEEGDRILCEYKEGRKAAYACHENLELENLKVIKENDAVTFVCICNEHNFKVLAGHWDLFKSKKALTFIFLSPELTEKWVIKPYVHAKIADPSTLKQGLRTMYETCLGRTD